MPRQLVLDIQATLERARVAGAMLKAHQSEQYRQQRRQQAAAVADSKSSSLALSLGRKNFSLTLLEEKEGNIVARKEFLKTNTHVKRRTAPAPNR